MFHYCLEVNTVVLPGSRGWPLGANLETIQRFVFFVSTSLTKAMTNEPALIDLPFTILR
jgi:hypothetical protein